MTNTQVAFDRDGCSHVDRATEADIEDWIENVVQDMVGGLGGELAIDMEDEVAEHKDQVEAGKGGQKPVEDLLPQLPAAKHNQ